MSVYPNPYYGTHELEGSRAEKYVSFNHLPEEATIDIYSLGGVYVKSIEKHDASQFAQWDLKNQYGYPVASGLYIARIKSGGNEKILKKLPNQNHEFLENKYPYTINPGGPNHEELVSLIGINDYFENIYQHHFQKKSDSIRAKIDKINHKHDK